MWVWTINFINHTRTSYFHFKVESILRGAFEEVFCHSATLSVVSICLWSDSFFQRKQQEVPSPLTTYALNVFRWSHNGLDNMTNCTKFILSLGPRSPPLGSPQTNGKAIQILQESILAKTLNWVKDKPTKHYRKGSQLFHKEKIKPHNPLSHIWYKVVTLRTSVKLTLLDNFINTPEIRNEMKNTYSYLKHSQPSALDV